MNAGEWTGILGVSILLLAYALNVFKKLASDSALYLFMNFVGALLAGISAFLIPFWPFVLLEGVWSLSTLVLLLRKLRS
ncbi:MAG TPA: hypothetical protein PLQ93_05175 [Bacteroidia bacterium]|nr:hypothetical protein [Bacteroidia bacterium]